MPRRSICRRRLNRWLDGQLDLAGLLGLSADDRALLLWEAHSRRQAGSVEQAQRIYELLAQLSGPNDVAAVLGLAVCQQTLGMLAEAERGYDAVLASDPSNLFALANRAEVRLLTGRNEQARADIAAAREILDHDGPADLRPRIERLHALAAEQAAAVDVRE